MFKSFLKKIQKYRVGFFQIGTQSFISLKSIHDFHSMICRENEIIIYLKEKHYFFKTFPAHGMKYLKFGASVWPPSCCRHASSPSNISVFTGGIFSFR